MDIPIPNFAVNLGNGLFIDSSGKLTSSVPGNIATFSLSESLPIPKEAVQAVFGPVGAVLPQLEKVGAALIVKDGDFFKALGMTDDLIDTFAKAMGITSMVASVIPYVNIAVAILNILTSFFGGGGSDPLAELIKREFARLHERLNEADRRALEDYVASCRAAFDPALTAVAAFHTTVSKPKAYRGPGELENKRQLAKMRVLDVQEKLTDTLLHSWALPLNPDDYCNHWKYMQNTLHTTPKSGTEKPAQFPGEFVPFDHRPMVQMLVYGIQVYLTLIKVVVPEHRTTGEYHTALRQAAEKLSDQLEKMREQTLARTIYKAGVPYFKKGPRQFFRLSVGAMDLRNDTDEYMLQTYNKSNHPEWGGSSGNIYDWWTLAPAIPNQGTPVEVDGDDWWTINPAAVAEANKQSEREYAAVLTRSGYFQLAHLEALLRHLSTEPDRSETVTSKAETLRKALPATDVPVRNDTIPFSPPIEATASREPQECKGHVTLTTQTIPNDGAIRYRIRLLTLPNGRTETPFENYAWTSYVPDGPRNRKLEINVNDGMALDPVGNNGRLLVDSISPTAEIKKSGTVTLTADTFDWYIPKPDNPIAFTRIQDMIKLGVATPSGLGTGAQTIPMPPPAPGTGTADVKLWANPRLFTSTELIKGYGWDESSQDYKGEKREWVRKAVEIQYELYWHEEELSISLKARPQDRNYVVYVVVEEHLPRSGQYLRTGVHIRVTGQLTYVPQSFFDAEQEAMNRANGILTRIEKNYSISREPGPADPVVGWLRPGVMTSVEGMQEFLEAAQQHAPEIVERTIAEAREEQRALATAS